ncbi:MAG: hypothetical protein KF893_21975 [Caldilineaceae bacterium]|nr:hypothetical protein [Caldilineaceae bacterium]
MNHTSMPLLVSLSRQFERLEPLKEKKNPLVAFMMGFAFGPFGTGIYLASWADFFFAFAILIALGIVIPGVGLLPGWLLSGAYATVRVITSNDKLDAFAQQRRTPLPTDDQPGPSEQPE